MRIHRGITLFISAAVTIPIALALASCASGGGFDLSFKATSPRSSQTQSARPSESAAPVTVGSMITDNTTLQDNQFAYPLPGAKQMLVQSDKPLPTAVAADIQSQINSLAAKYPPNAASSKIAPMQTAALSSQIARTTGKQVVIVISAFGIIDLNSRTPVVFWPVVINGQGQPFATKAAAMSYAESYIASQSNQNEWLLVTPQ